MSVGDFSGVINNKNGSFSVLRIEAFLDEEPFTLERVYSQIERKIRKEKQDSIKKHLGENLFNLYSIKTNKEVLSF